MSDANETRQAEPDSVPSGPAPPITSRFLYVDIAALRAKQLKRGAQPRLSESEGVHIPHKAERVAMEEVRQGLVYYDIPGPKAKDAEGDE